MSPRRRSQRVGAPSSSASTASPVRRNTDTPPPPIPISWIPCSPQRHIGKNFVEGEYGLTTKGECRAVPKAVRHALRSRECGECQLYNWMKMNIADGGFDTRECVALSDADCAADRKASVMHPSGFRTRHGGGTDQETHTPSPPGHARRPAPRSRAPPAGHTRTHSAELRNASASPTLTAPSGGASPPRTHTARRKTDTQQGHNAHEEEDDDREELEEEDENEDDEEGEDGDPHEEEEDPQEKEEEEEDEEEEEEEDEEEQEEEDEEEQEEEDEEEQDEDEEEKQDEEDEEEQDEEDEEEEQENGRRGDKRHGVTASGTAHVVPSPSPSHMVVRPQPRHEAPNAWSASTSSPARPASASDRSSPTPPASESTRSSVARVSPVPRVSPASSVSSPAPAANSSTPQNTNPYFVGTTGFQERLAQLWQKQNARHTHARMRGQTSPRRTATDTPAKGSIYAPARAQTLLHAIHALASETCAPEWATHATLARELDDHMVHIKIAAQRIYENSAPGIPGAHADWANLLEGGLRRTAKLVFFGGRSKDTTPGITRETVHAICVALSTLRYAWAIIYTFFTSSPSGAAYIRTPRTRLPDIIPVETLQFVNFANFPDENAVALDAGLARKARAHTEVMLDMAQAALVQRASSAIDTALVDDLKASVASWGEISKRTRGRGRGRGRGSNSAGPRTELDAMHAAALKAMRTMAIVIAKKYANTVQIEPLRKLSAMQIIGALATRDARYPALFVPSARDIPFKDDVFSLVALLNNTAETRARAILDSKERLNADMAKTLARK